MVVLLVVVILTRQQPPEEETFFEDVDVNVPPTKETNTLSSSDSNTNILMLMVDQARPDAFSITGANAAAYTPNIDKIARQGAYFQNAFSSTPMCTPARQALMTGKKPWSHGMRGYASEVVPEKFVGSWVILPKLLADHGYYTASIAKNHFGYNHTTLEWWAHGFAEQHVHEGGLACDPALKAAGDFVLLDAYDRYFNESCPECDPLATKPSDQENGWWGSAYVYNESLHPTAWTGQVAVDWLGNWSNRNEARPFFLKVSFLRPHSPYDPPQRWYDFYEDRSADLPAPAYSTNGGWDEKFAGPSHLCNMSNDATYCGNPGDDLVLASRIAYFGSVSFVDEWVGKIWTQLQTTDLLENTFILFLADHGDSLGDHNLWRKGHFTQQVATIPFYLRWPVSMDTMVSVPRNSTMSQVVEIRDVLPTFVDVASISLTTAEESEIDGSSLVGLLKGTTTSSWRSWVDLEFASCGFNASMNWNALTDGKTKFVHSIYDGSQLLFNLTNDPYEQINLASEPQYNSTLHLWRSRMVEQFQDEGRDYLFLNGAQLATLQENNKQCWSAKFMENYPCYPSQCANT